MVGVLLPEVSAADAETVITVDPPPEARPEPREEGAAETAVADPPRLLVGIPAGPTCNTLFTAHRDTLISPPGRAIMTWGKGPYVAMNCRAIVQGALQVPGWHRLLFLETDMLPQTDALVRHYHHTEPVVGSMYMMHNPPYLLNAQIEVEGGFRYHTPAEIYEMSLLPDGELIRVAHVGLGLTSIRRDVLENWPPHEPIFQNGWSEEPNALLNAYGEVSHDAMFTRRCHELGIPVYLDPNCRADHLSEQAVGLATCLAHHGYPYRHVLPEGA